MSFYGLIPDIKTRMEISMLRKTSKAALSGEIEKLEIVVDDISFNTASVIDFMAIVWTMIVEYKTFSDTAKSVSQES